jgi:hypothetical protein
MKLLTVVLDLIASGILIQMAYAQFPNFPAADMVLGRADFTTPRFG